MISNVPVYAINFVDWLSKTFDNGGDYICFRSNITDLPMSVLLPQSHATLVQPCRVCGTSNSSSLITEDDALEAMDSEDKDDSLSFGQPLSSDEDTRRMKMTLAVNNHP